MVVSNADEKCQSPPSQPCTSIIPSEIEAAGLGLFYQYPCSEVGCNFLKANCRLCAVHRSKINNPYPECPPCLKRVQDPWESSKTNTACSLPKQNSCTAGTPPGVTAVGLGVFYQYPCHEVGCNFFRPFCRLCAKHPPKINNPYPECPKCVA